MQGLNISSTPSQHCMALSKSMSKHHSRESSGTSFDCICLFLYPPYFELMSSSQHSLSSNTWRHTNVSSQCIASAFFFLLANKKKKKKKKKKSKPEITPRACVLVCALLLWWVFLHSVQFNSSAQLNITAPHHSSTQSIQLRQLSLQFDPQRLHSLTAHLIAAP
ncbi:hypothetical protein MVEG_01495 [Podila verticillata NRRL 6337]|nr:hypothetical protein MVEG_01495 [Podila verticillata NRRL 6337]